MSFFAQSASKPAVIITGIEAHICVTQTTLDLLRHGHKVYVLADGVSSCNKEEVPVALARLRAEGATVTTSESFLYECMGDAGIAEYEQTMVEIGSALTLEQVQRNRQVGQRDKGEHLADARGAVQDLRRQSQSEAMA